MYCVEPVGNWTDVEPPASVVFPELGAGKLWTEVRELRFETGLKLPAAEFAGGRP